MRINRWVTGLVAVMWPGIAWAQASFDATRQMFRLDGGEVTYAFKVNAQGILQSVYWGRRLPDRAPLNTNKSNGQLNEPRTQREYPRLLFYPALCSTPG